MPDLVEATNVVIINSEFPSSPRQCLLALQNLGGNLKAFAEKFTADRDEQCKLLYQARKLLETEPMMLESWDRAIKNHQQNVWQLLQCDALQALEDALDELPHKEAAVVAKTVLTPLLAQMTAEAKKGDDDALPPPPDENEEEGTGDDMALLQALGLA